jgi:predicted AlkP superfamily phosphohydrolase/phosphomutase
MLTPNGYGRTAPAEIEADLASAGLVIDWEEVRDLDGAVTLPDDEAKLALYLMDNSPWQLFFTVFRASDAIFHTHPGEADARREMFRRIDRHVGAMRERLERDDVLMLVSDHGMTELREVFHVNSALERAGLLARRSQSSAPGERAYGLMERFKNAAVFDNPIVKNPATRSLAERLRRRTLQRRLDFGREGKRQPRLSESLIDWTRTVCFYVDLGYGSGVFLNVRGREPLGIVEPGAYEATRQRVSAELSKHEGIVVRRREDVYVGPFVDLAPDLLVSTNREELGLSGRMLDMPDRTPVEVPYFHHTRRGIWVAYGAGIRRGASLGPFDITDVCATVLHMLGAAVPDDLDGGIRLDFFEESAEPVKRPARFVSIGGVTPAESAEDFDDEAIKEQLRGLGYMN